MINFVLMFVKFKTWWREFRLSLRIKMILSILSIAVVLLMSIVISWLEYRHMSNYVSGMIADGAEGGQGLSILPQQFSF